jgi:cytochrome c553
VCRAKRTSTHLLVVVCVFLAAGSLRAKGQAQGGQAASSSNQPALDYEFFKTKVEPIFLAQRPHRARCVACHARAGNNSAFRLVPLSPGSTTWTEEQSRQNFANTQEMVIPGMPDQSPLLFHALAEQGGGDFYHSGGKQFDSKDNPEWQIMKAWVQGQRGQ